MLRFAQDDKSKIGAADEGRHGARKRPTFAAQMWGTRRFKETADPSLREGRQSRKDSGAGRDVSLQRCSCRPYGTLSRFFPLTQHGALRACAGLFSTGPSGLRVSCTGIREEGKKRLTFAAQMWGTEPVEVPQRLKPRPFKE